MNFSGIYICFNKKNKKHIPFGTCVNLFKEINTKNSSSNYFKYKMFLFEYNTISYSKDNTMTIYENESDFYKDFFPLTYKVTLYKTYNKKNLKNLYIKLFKKKLLKDKYIKKEEYFLNIEEKFIVKINSKIIVYLYLIKSKHFLSCYYDEIKYSFISLNNLYREMNILNKNIDFDLEIEKISVLFKSLYELYIQLNKNNNITNYIEQYSLENHHKLIEEITKKIIKTKEKIKKD